MTVETQLEFSRWREVPRGLAYRRWVIISTGLRQMLAQRFFRILLFLAWTAGLLTAAAGFLLTQSIATGGWLESWAASFGPRGQAVASAFSALVLLYPEICIGGLFTLLFWVQSVAGLLLSLVALSVVVPRLVTRDRATNALTIYLSRPLRSIDYLFGKLGIIVGILVVAWTGPLLFSWVLSMLFAPGTDFFVYSLEPLGRALLFNLVSLVVLAAIALGTSAVSRSSGNTVLLWIGLWIIAWAMARFSGTPDWLRHASFCHDLLEVQQAIFQADRALIDAAESLPLLSRNLADTFTQAGEHLQAKDTAGAFAGLAVLVGLSSVVFFRRLKPE